MGTQQNNTLVQLMLSLLTKKVYVPSDFVNQAAAVKEMQSDDVSGLVDSLTDFAVQEANVKFTIESDNQELSKTLKKWAKFINKDFLGKIPVGLKPLAKEYFKERWKYSSFPILRIAGWKKVDGIVLPTMLAFVDGSNVKAEDKNEGSANKGLLDYDYYLGDSKLDKNVIITKPYGRWYDKYPTPYLIKRGIYHNYKIIESLKNHETKVLEQIIPYLLYITKGSAKQPDVTYEDEQLKKVINQMQGMVDTIKNNKNITNKTPVRASNWDEEFKHLIPDLSSIFAPKLFTVAEKNILSGFGFLDIAEALSSNRKESILSPKVFIKEVKAGVEDFKQLLNSLLIQILDKNKETHPKYMNSDFYITNSPISGFNTDAFRSELRLLWNNGKLSDETYCELVGEVDYDTEKYRRVREAKSGDEVTMVSRPDRNLEDFQNPRERKKQEKFNVDLNEDGTPKDKNKIDDKKKFDKSGKKKELITSPYRTIKSLPKKVKNNVSKALQKVYLKVFNDAYEQYHDDSKASATAWKIVKKKGRKNKDGKWVKK